MTIHTLLVDDEKNNLDNLSYLLGQHCKQLSIVGRVCSVKEAIPFFEKGMVDLVFLDIHMPEEDGFELLKKFESPDFETVFVTAYDNYALKAIKFSALDYLLKPIEIDELKGAVAKVCERMKNKIQANDYRHLISWMETNPTWDDRRIGISNSKETRYVKISEIIRCESANNYTNLYLTNGEKLVSSRPIYEYEELLEPAGFLRIHQSYLVNKKKIRSYRKQDGGSVVLEDGSQVPVSKHKKDLLKAL